MSEVLKLIFRAVSYVLCGLAYKSLLDDYLGFIPLAGDLVCKYRIASEYENEYKTKYLISSISFTVLSIIIVIFSLIFVLIGDTLVFNLLITIGSISLIVIAIICVYYTYKILYPLVQDLTGDEKVGGRTFLFSFIPTIFYIWLLIKCNEYE